MRMNGCAEEIVRINNRGPGERIDFEARNVVDAGFLELVRYGVRRADDPIVVDSLKVIDHVLKVETPSDRAGDAITMMAMDSATTAVPILGWGQGRAWPLLTGERAHYELAAGHDVKPYILASKGSVPRAVCCPNRSGMRPTCPSWG